MARKYTKVHFFIKPVIDALRKGAKTWSELKELKPEISDSTLEKVLKEHLQYWELAKEIDGQWYWYEYSRVFSSEQEYKIAVEHSRVLLSVFDDIVSISFDSQIPLFRAVVEHLETGYPQIYEKLVKFLNLMNEKNEELLRKYSQEIKNLQMGYVDYEYHPFQLLQFLFCWKPKPENLEMKNEMLSVLKPLFEVYRSLSGELSLLKLKIENGTPLEGRCFLCPKVKVQEGKA
jgi:hypothetical protein